MINDGHLVRCCLLRCKAHLSVACSPLEPSISQDFGLSTESVKNFFACGGLRVSGHSTWLPYCLPAADRGVWLCFRRYDFRFSSEGCCGLAKLNHGIFDLAAAACA